MNTRYTAGIWPAKAPFWASFLLIKMILITSATGRGQSFDLAGSYRCVGNGQAATVYQPSGEPGLFDVDFVELTLKTRGDLIELTLLKEFGSDPTPGYQLVTNPKLGLERKVVAEMSATDGGRTVIAYKVIGRINEEGICKLMGQYIHQHYAYRVSEDSRSYSKEVISEVPIDSFTLHLKYQSPGRFILFSPATTITEPFARIRGGGRVEARSSNAPGENGARSLGDQTKRESDFQDTSPNIGLTQNTDSPNRIGSSHHSPTPGTMQASDAANMAGYGLGKATANLQSELQELRVKSKQYRHSTRLQSSVKSDTYDLSDWGAPTPSEQPVESVIDDQLNWLASSAKYFKQMFSSAGKYLGHQQIGTVANGQFAPPGDLYHNTFEAAMGRQRALLNGGPLPSEGTVLAPTANWLSGTVYGGQLGDRIIDYEQTGNTAWSTLTKQKGYLSGTKTWLWNHLIGEVKGQ